MARVPLALALCVLTLASRAAAHMLFNQSARYVIDVVTTDWSNYDEENGGCVTCPYTCVKRSTGPTGTSLNLSNATLMGALPAIYSQPVMNGCCYASKGKSAIMPDCNKEASPASAEACGFLYGPTLKWRIDNALTPESDPVTAILFASIDCNSFWAVGKQAIKYTSNTKSVTGKKQINGGCYGDPKGVPMVLAGCLTSKLKYDKSRTYSWDQLGGKCQGLSGVCAITNGVWGEHLKCCTKRTGLTSTWNLQYKKYTQESVAGVRLSGPAIVGIVFGGVCLLLLLVHFGGKARQRAIQTALMREQEGMDDYEEVMTPLVNGPGGDRKPAPLQRPIGPASLEVSLHEGDQIFRKQEAEVLYEGDM